MWTAADIGKLVRVTSFRHTMATLDVETAQMYRFIQAIAWDMRNLRTGTHNLHSSLRSANLKEIHEATHPGKNEPGRNRRTARRPHRVRADPSKSPSTPENPSSRRIVITGLNSNDKLPFER